MFGLITLRSCHATDATSCQIKKWVKAVVAFARQISFGSPRSTPRPAAAATMMTRCDRPRRRGGRPGPPAASVAVDRGGAKEPPT